MPNNSAFLLIWQQIFIFLISVSIIFILYGGIKMGAGGVPNRTCEIIDGRPGDLPICGAKPNSRYDLYVKGKRYQSRWYDSEGRVVRNRDYQHQDNNNSHYFPHDHVWNWIQDRAIRDKNFVLPDYVKFK